MWPQLGSSIISGRDVPLGFYHKGPPCSSYSARNQEGGKYKTMDDENSSLFFRPQQTFLVFPILRRQYGKQPGIGMLEPVRL